MRADGRRLGRIIGQLDDLEILLTEYSEFTEYPGATTQASIWAARQKVYEASGNLQDAVREINRLNNEGRLANPFFAPVDVSDGTPV